jgi:hypothetical protein
MPNLQIIKFNYEGFEYQAGLDSIERAAIAGLGALQDDLFKNAKCLQQYRSEGVFEGERDENGTTIYEVCDDFRFEMAVAVDSQNELRRAFVLAAYHFWERSVVRWALVRNLKPKSKKKDKNEGAFQGYDELKTAAENEVINYPPHPDLQAVSQIANVLKHESKKSQKKLKEDHPALWAELMNVVHLPFGRPEGLKISDPIMRKIFEIIRQSGPYVSPEKKPPIETIFPKKESPDAR